jgi:hypothetical protein
MGTPFVESPFEPEFFKVKPPAPKPSWEDPDTDVIADFNTAVEQFYAASRRVHRLFPIVPVYLGWLDPDDFDSRRHDIFGSTPFTWFTRLTYYRPGPDLDLLITPRLTGLQRRWHAWVARLSWRWAL